MPRKRAAAKKAAMSSKKASPAESAATNPTPASSVTNSEKSSAAPLSTKKTEEKRTAARGLNQSSSRKKLKSASSKEEDKSDKHSTTVASKSSKVTPKSKTTKKSTPTINGNGIAPRAKRTHAKPDYDEVWKQVYLAGTEWDQMKQIYSIDWDFDHLDEALTNGDLSDGRQVYLFGATEPQLVMMNENDEKGDVVPIPSIIAVVSEVKPPSEVGIKSVQRAEEEIVPMSDLRIEWQPHLPSNLSSRRGFKPNVQILGCSQRRARLKNMKEDAVHRYDYVLPYFFDPEKQEEVTEETEVEVLAELEGIQAPLMCEFDYELDDLDEFVDEQISERDDLKSDKHKDQLKKAIKDAVTAAKLKYKKEKQERQKKLDAISSEEREAIKNTKLIKFYPMNEWPDISSCKSPYINRYYGKASEVRDDLPDDDE